MAESFFQLLAASPKTPSLCRVVLVTSDVLLTQAVKERIVDSPNANVLANVEELKGLINTIVSNVGEEFIAQIKPKAAKVFFVSSEDKDTVFYKEKIKERLEEKFNSELQTKPQGTTFRKNGTWRIGWPNFSRKEGRRVFWASHIEIELEAGTVTNEDEPKGGIHLSSLLSASGANVMAPPQQGLSYYPPGGLLKFENIAQNLNLPDLYGSVSAYASEKRVTTHKGKDIFEVLWSTEVTMSKDLKKPIIEDITHVELSCQPIL